MTRQRLPFWVRAFSTLWVLTTVATVATLAQAAPPPTEAFFQQPAFSQAQLSPDGRHVALVAGGKGTRQRLVVMALDTQKLQVVGGFDDRDVRAVQWVNDRRLVYDLEVQLTGLNRVDEGRGLFAVDVDGGSHRQLIESVRSFARDADMGVPALSWRHFVVAVPGLGLGDSIYVGMAGEVSREKVDYIDIQRLDTRSGRTADVDTPPHARDWVIGHDAKVLAALTVKGGQHAWQVRQADGSWRASPPFDPIDPSGEGGVSLLWQGPDGTLYGTAGHQGMNALFSFDKTSGRPVGPPLVATSGFDVNPGFIANAQRLLGVRHTVDAEVTQWFDPGLQALQADIDKRLPATSNRISVARHGDSPWALVQASADVQPTVSHAFNRSTGKLLRLGASLPGINAQHMGQTDFHRITARDGLPLPAYLTLPPGGGKKLPLVVLVHGGPWVRGADWTFDPEVQFLASRGYAVLQPAFRGSTGYGWRHFEAGFKQWGLAMQDDIADATRWAVAQGHADPARICIAGASYGGYAALMGLVRDPALYRCGIGWLAVTDPRLLFDNTWSDANEEAKRYGLQRLIGDPVADAARLLAASPLHQAARITQPLLLAYGAWDTRVPLVHGERLRSALRPHNPAVQWLLYPTEGHGWAQVETRVDFWNRVDAFLARHIGKP